jgi:hypothetical protein
MKQLFSGTATKSKVYVGTKHSKWRKIKSL